MTASDPLFAEWDELLTMYAAILNPLCFVNLAQVDTQTAEYKADVAVWARQVEEEFVALLAYKAMNQ